MTEFQSVLTLYNRDGVPLAEPVGCIAVRSWLLSNVGLATITLPRTDPIVTQANFQFGNAVTVDHNRAGRWGGFLWPDPQGQEWRYDTVTFYAYSAEWKFKTRRLVPETLKGVQAGTAFATMLSNINGQEDSLIRPGSIDVAGAPNTWRLGGMAIDVLTNMIAHTGYDYALTVDTSTGLLRFLANWSARMGRVWNVQLEEGKNIELLTGAGLVVQGPIVNDSAAQVTTPGDRWDVTKTATSIDTASRYQYGLAQNIIVPTGKEPNIQAAADAQIKQFAQPRKTYPVTALDVDNTFDYLGVGDTLYLYLPSYDFGGTDCQVRVLGRSFDDTLGKMDLTLDKLV